MNPAIGSKTLPGMISSIASLTREKKIWCNTLLFLPRTPLWKEALACVKQDGRHSRWQLGNLCNGSIFHHCNSTHLTGSVLRLSYFHVMKGRPTISVIRIQASGLNISTRSVAPRSYQEPQLRLTRRTTENSGPSAWCFCCSLEGPRAHRTVSQRGCQWIGRQTSACSKHWASQSHTQTCESEESNRCWRCACVAP